MTSSDPEKRNGHIDLNQQKEPELEFDENLILVTPVKSYVNRVQDDEIQKDMEDVTDAFRKDQEEQSKNDNISMGTEKSICIVLTSIKISPQRKKIYIKRQVELKRATSVLVHTKNILEALDKRLYREFLAGKSSTLSVRQEKVRLSQLLVESATILRQNSIALPKSICKCP